MKNTVTRSPDEIVRTYFSRVRAGGEGVADLFAADAELRGLGRRVSGQAAIREFYASAIEGGGPNPGEPVSLVVEGERVFAEIEIRLRDGSTIHAVDLFRIDGDRIQSLTYYLADLPPEPSAS